MPPLVLVPPAGGDSLALRRQAFGRRLTAARDRRGVALEDIAQRMKVSAGLLASLEHGDASRWPKGIFRRAFFRDYAVAIGLPAEPYVTEFLLLFPDGEDHPLPALPIGDVPSLRLSLAAGVSGSLTRNNVRREFFALLPILLIALALTVASGGRVYTFLAVVALCYYWRAVGVAKRWAVSRRREQRMPPQVG